MVTCQRRKVFVTGILLVVFLMGGCGKPVKRDEGFRTTIDLGTTIGSLVDVYSFDTISVEGYSLVGELKGMGSSECPPQLRAYLEQYILTQLPRGEISISELINSRDTAVVVLKGTMPATVSKNSYFDVSVTALTGTQTTSLEGGWLYGAELKAAGSFGISTKVLANVQGPVFIDTIDAATPEKRGGYILGGGVSVDEYKISLSLRHPDYRIATLISNKLNGRFGGGTANAVSPGHIILKVPAEYVEQKQRFISIVKATYLSETPEAIKERINTHIQELAVSDSKDISEAALESIGNAGLSKLRALLNSSNEEVRLRAARVMLNLGSDAGLDVLRETASDTSSGYRIEALESITRSASRNDAAVISRKLLRDGDFDIRLAAYEQLLELDDITIRQKAIARSFYLEEITQTPYKTICVTRSGQPRIVLFGVPIKCRDNIFVQSPDGYITINAPAGQKYVSLMRKHPKRPNVILQLKSTFGLSDIIQTLCGEPKAKAGQRHGGLGVSYSEAIALLKQMSEKGAVSAEFRAGPLPKISLNIKQKESIDR